MRKAAIIFLARLDNRIYHLISQLAGAEEQSLHPKHRLMNYHQFFVDNVRTTDSVLDIGCGNGYLTYDIAKKAKRVVGVDFVPESIEEAKRRFSRRNLKYICDDATTYPFKGTFDVATLSNVLEHIDDRVGLLKKLQALASKFLIRVPMFDREWMVAYKKEIGVEWRLDVTHTIEYTKKTFEEEMAQAGLIIESLSIQYGEIWAVLKTKR